MTSAPKSANSMPQKGPAATWQNSTTRTPANGAVEEFADDFFMVVSSLIFVDAGPAQSLLSHAIAVAAQGGSQVALQRVGQVIHQVLRILQADIETHQLTPFMPLCAH